jgi:hypothetical protein
LFGLAAAYVYVTSVEEGEERPEFGLTQAAAIGLAGLGILRQISALPEGQKVKRKVAEKVGA